MGRFENQTVIVTGGARGMGASYACGFVAEGANVVISDVLEQEGVALSAELGDQAIFALHDVTSEADWAATVAAAEDAFGPVSVLVNNAGIARTATLEELKPAAWRQVIDVNLTGQYLGIRAVVPSMRKAGGGAILNISSVVGLIAIPMEAAYVASKWGLRGLTKTAALELGRDNIRVNSIHPGAIDTPMVEVARAPNGTPIVGTGPISTYAIPRFAESNEVTRLVLFVASGEAGFSTGSEFVADGGMGLGPALQPEVAEAAVA
jgi:3alpha(or 20beta)-hydroxysteroid dehydrogenase